MMMSDYEDPSDDYNPYYYPPSDDANLLVGAGGDHSTSPQSQQPQQQQRTSTTSDNNNNGDAAAVDFDDPAISSLPRVLLMGPRRGGKTSIQRVVFQKMSPHETLFRLEATQGLERSLVDHTPLCRFTIWDFPGEYYGGNNSSSGSGEDSNTNNKKDSSWMSESEKFFAGSTSLIFVVDAQDEPYDHVLQSFTNVVTRALEINPNIAVEVFINKVDGELFLSDESKYDCRRDVMTQVSDELTDAGVSPDAIQIRYHLTSIYDHSIYEALSRVVQRLIAQLPTLENLLNVLVSTCSMEKAYLFDVVSKLYISTDSGPVDGQSIELCSDMLDVVLDVSGIYGLGPSHAVHHAKSHSELRLGGGVRTGSGSTDGSELLVGTTLITGSSSSQAITAQPVEEEELEEIVDADSAYDRESASVIRLSNGMVLYLKEVDTMLALVCITRAENFRKKALINYNIGCLRSALRALVQPPHPHPNGKGGATASSPSLSPSLTGIGAIPVSQHLSPSPSLRVTE